MTKDEMVGWHHQLNEHQFEQTPGDREGQGSVVCCIPWGRKELDTTEQQELSEEEPSLTTLWNKWKLFSLLSSF